MTSASPDTSTSWPDVGDEVVEYTSLRFGDPDLAHLVRAVVVRVGKRDVVLDNGHRYNKHHLAKQGGTAWDPTTYLLSPSDDRIVRAERANHLANLDLAVNTAYDAWRRSRSEEETSALLAAVSRLIEAKSGDQ